MKFSEISERIWDILVCPHCGSSLLRTDNGAKCSYCGEEYVYSNNGQLDLRLKRKKLYKTEFELGTILIPKESHPFRILQKNPSPEVDFSDVRVPYHLSQELMSYFPKAKRNNSIMLDIGCGSTVHKEICEHPGFKYIGLDYSSPNAPILGDAHALPFKDNSFDFILSIAALEHIRYPFVMVSEAYRVLKPGEKFIGTAAFLEPFHSNSFYHHTHLGVFNTLQFAGFDIDIIAPSIKWSVLIAQASMILFPKLHRLFSKSIVMPIYLLHKLYWEIGAHILGKKVEKYRAIATTGSFSFIASKLNNRKKQ